MPESSLLSPRAPLCLQSFPRAPHPPVQVGHKVHSVVPRALLPASGDPAEDLAGLPELTFGRIFTTWGIDPLLFIGLVWAAGLYAYGVYVLHQRGDRWPVGRSVGFGLGIATFFFVTHSGLGAYDTVLLSVHMVQHMVLSMVVPLLLALGAPVTLALRTLPRKPRGWLLAVLHSRVAKVLSFPPLTLALFIVSPWMLYFSPWYDASLTSEYIHEMTHVHLVLVGCLFFWPLVGADPVPGKVSYPFRLLLMVMTLPFHAILGLAIMDQQTLIGREWYLSLREGPLGSWLPSAAEDQHLAGGILWGSGELVGLLFVGVLFVQWVRSSMAEARREDRRLDRLERRERLRQG